MARAVVIGAGVAGLGSALTLARSGHAVTLLERDATPLPADPDGAFAWDRRGAPQVRHSHAMLARLRNLLRDRYPDVLGSLLEAGATEMDFVAMMPEGMDRTPLPGDEDLVALACRRTTFEWVLRRAVLAENGVRLVDGVAVTGLRTSGTVDGVPLVVGVHGTDAAGAAAAWDADVVVAANGRRSTVPAWLGELGVELDEHTEDTGIVYYSRFFALGDGHDMPQANGPIGGDLGYLKYGVFVGDNRTFSVTLACQVDDELLRRRLSDPEVFGRVAASIPATAPYMADGLAAPITGVNVMASLLNRQRRFVDTDGRPLVAGFHAVGDAHTCTNPLYGRGCSLAVVQAQLLADALTEHPHDHLARSVAYETASRREIHPWYRAAVVQDGANRAEAQRRRLAPDPGGHPGGGGSGEGAAPADEDPMRALMRDGLLPAVRLDPVVFRAFLRMFNLLESPDSLMGNAEVIGRVMAVYQERDQRPPEPALGPERDTLLAAVA